MTSENDIKNLEKRLGYFLSSSRYAKKSKIFEKFVEPMKQVGRVCLFGGLIRDLMFHDARHFSSDLDFVIDVDDEEGFQKLVVQLKPTKNSFGGYRACLNGYKVDFWDVKNTWVNNNKVSVNADTLECLIETTFFNLDAAIYDLEKRKVHMKRSFREGLSNRLLDINLEENPNPDGAAVRAIRRMWTHDLMASETLVEFISDRICTSGWDSLAERDRSAYPSNPILRNLFPDSSPCPTEFKIALGKERSLRKPRQLSLPV
jgi:predicted nucleotidyltransferase